jgi:hypothetical protein
LFVRLGLKSSPGTNTLAYYENSEITDKKLFITLAPGWKIMSGSNALADFKNL